MKGFLLTIVIILSCASKSQAITFYSGIPNNCIYDVMTGYAIGQLVDQVNY